MALDEGKFLSFPKDLIECPVCLGTFSQPKVLPCQHTFCLTCLDRLPSQNQSITCPICQRITVLPPNGTSQLPTNFLLVHLLDVSKPTSTDSGDVICDACASSSSSSNVTTAEGYCVDCAQSLCRSCVTAHSGIRSLRHHQLISIGSNDPERLRKLLMDRPSYCADHPTNEIAFHCRQCCSSICVKCAFLGHKNHDCTDIKEKAQELRQEIKEMVEKISLKTLSWRTSNKELHKDLLTFDELIQGIKEQIVDKTKEAINHIRCQEKRLLETVEKFEKEYKTPIELLTCDVESKVAYMESFVQFCRHLKESGTHTDVVRLWPDLSAKGDEHHAMSIPGAVLPEFRFTPSATKLDEINVIGDIKATTSDKTEDICTNCSTIVSSSTSPDVLCHESKQLTPMFVKGIQEDTGRVKLHSQQSLQSQDSLRTSDEEEESIDSAYTCNSSNSSDHSLEDHHSLANENKDCWGVIYDPQCEAPAVNNENYRTDNDSHDSSSVNAGSVDLYKEHQEEEEIAPDLMSQQSNRKSSLVGIDTIDGKEPVTGLAILDFLYVSRLHSNRLESYDLQTLELVSSVEFEEITSSTDLTACESNRTIYIGHIKSIVFAFKVTKPTSPPKRLPVAFSYKHLSITAESSVLMGCPNAHVILEYKEMPAWTELRRISIPNSYPTSMVQISPDFFVVSSKMNVLFLVRMSGSKLNYERISIPHNISYIVPDSSKPHCPRLLVANCYGHSILRLDLGTTSTYQQSFPIVDPKTVSKPSRLWMDKGSRRLFVGTAHGDVKVLNFMRLSSAKCRFNLP